MIVVLRCTVWHKFECHSARFIPLNELSSHVSTYMSIIFLPFAAGMASVAPSSTGPPGGNRNNRKSENI